MKIFHDIALDVSRQGVQAVIPLAQHSAGVHRLVFTLRNGSVPIVFGERDGASLYVEGDIIDGCTVYTNNSAYPNCIVCDISAGVASKSGQLRAVLQLYKDDEAFTYSPEIMFNVSRDLTNGSKVQESPQYGAVVKAAFAAEQYALLAQRYAEKADDAVLKVRINEDTNTWEKSYDNGATWVDMGVQATGDKGEKGDKGEQGIQGIQGIQGVQGVQGKTGPQGVQGVRGEKGDPFFISKVYSSVAEMDAGYDTDGVPVGGFVVIDTGNVEDADNAKLFIKGNTVYRYLTDLSGAQGMRGPQGVQGIQGPEGPQGPKPVKGVDYYTDSDIKRIVDDVTNNFLNGDGVKY